MKQPKIPDYVDPRDVVLLSSNPKDFLRNHLKDAGETASPTQQLRYLASIKQPFESELVWGIKQDVGQPIKVYPVALRTSVGVILVPEPYPSSYPSVSFGVMVDSSTHTRGIDVFAGEAYFSARKAPAWSPTADSYPMLEGMKLWTSEVDGHPSSQKYVNSFTIVARYWNTLFFHAPTLTLPQFRWLLQSQDDPKNSEDHKLLLQLLARHVALPIQFLDSDTLALVRKLEANYGEKATHA